MKLNVYPGVARQQTWQHWGGYHRKTGKGLDSIDKDKTIQEASQASLELKKRIRQQIYQNSK
jgi:hypothetical protein